MKYEEFEPVQCAYCGKPPDGAMLSMGRSMAHAICVPQKLNELLDPDYDSEGKPAEVIGFLSKFEPVQLEVLSDKEITEIRIKTDEQSSVTYSRVTNPHILAKEI